MKNTTASRTSLGNVPTKLSALPLNDIATRTPKVVDEQDVRTEVQALAWTNLVHPPWLVFYSRIIGPLSFLSAVFLAVVAVIMTVYSRIRNYLRNRSQAR